MGPNIRETIARIVCEQSRNDKIQKSSLIEQVEKVHPIPFIIQIANRYISQLVENDCCNVSVESGKEVLIFKENYFTKKGISKDLISSITRPVLQ
jgi:hypothetical protein